MAVLRLYASIKNLVEDGTCSVWLRTEVKHGGHIVPQSVVEAWWGRSPLICLSKNPLSENPRCHYSIMDIWRHNSHLGHFDSRSAAAIYVASIRRRVREVLKVWPVKPKSKKKK